MSFTRRKEANFLYLSTILVFIVFTLLIKIYSHEYEKTCSFNSNLSSQFSSGLLIGFRNDLDKDTSTYRTLWITPDSNNNLKITNEMNFIVVPHKNNFWKIEPVRYNFTNTNDYTEYIIAHGFSDSYSPETFQYKYSTYRNKLNFVDKNFVGISTYINSHNDDKHYIDKQCAVVDLEDLSNYKNTENKITMKDIFKEKSSSFIYKYKNEKITSAESSEKNALNTTSGDNWNIGRQDGKWIAQIAKTFKSNTYKDYILYDTNLYLPQSIVSNNELCANYNSIKKLFPDVEDAISSPSKDTIGIFTPNKLTLYPYSNNSIGCASIDIDLSNNETMIMAHWASGEDIKNWTNNVKKYCFEN